MELKSAVLGAYLVGMLVTAAYLGWYLAFRLTSYNWIYDRTAIWIRFPLWVAAWPLLLLRPRMLKNTTVLLRTAPVCGETIRYWQGSAIFGDTSGEFFFPAVAVERFLAPKRHEFSKFPGEIQARALLWVIYRDSARKAPTDTPTSWVNFEHIASELIRGGIGSVNCTKCRSTYSTSALTCERPEGTGSYVYKNFYCPRRHELLSVFVAHVHFAES